MSALFAIVGSGPSGMYTADALIKHFPDCRVDVFDKCAMPFGLIRFGVAPDHFRTKNTARRYARTLELDNVRFLGNVSIGRDLSMKELEDNYDAVVMAIGAYNDRKLGIPGEDLPGVYGACAFVGWYNGHFDYRDLDPLLDGEGMAVIGIGNVALDVARVIAKTREEMRNTDICAHALDLIQNMPVKDIHIFGRRGAVEAGFTTKELVEILDLERCAVKVDGGQIPDEVSGGFDGRKKSRKEKNLEVLRQLAAQEKPEKPVKMHVHFYASPKEILGADRVEAILMERTAVVDGRAVSTGETFEVPCCSVVTAIGYFTDPPKTLPLDGATIDNVYGRVREGVYVVGWAKRGSSGTIPTNGPDSRSVVDLLIADVDRVVKPGGEVIDSLLSERNIRVIDFEDAKKIRTAEIERATDGHPQEKFTRLSEVLTVLDD